MQAVRLSPEIAASSSDLQTGAGRSDADVDGLAGFPTTDPTDKPEQLSLDLGDEMSLFTRLLTRAAPLPTAPATSAERVEAAANNMVYEVQRFAALVRGEDPAPDQERTLAVLRIIAALRARA